MFVNMQIDSILRTYLLEYTAWDITKKSILSGPARQEIGGVPTPLCIISIRSSGPFY